MVDFSDSTTKKQYEASVRKQVELGVPLENAQMITAVMMSDPPTEQSCHCWEPGPETEDGCSTTCMLADGHSGPHEWSRDDEIGISFSEDGE